MSTCCFTLYHSVRTIQGTTFWLSATCRKVPFASSGTALVVRRVAFNFFINIRIDFETKRGFVIVSTVLSETSYGQFTAVAFAYERIKLLFMIKSFVTISYLFN